VSLNPPLTIAGWLRFDAINRALERVGPRRVLEVGCGQGALGSWLAPDRIYVGVEPDAESRAVASERLRPHSQARLLVDLADLGDRHDGCASTPERFDLVVACEVLEHIADDGGALRRWRTLVDSAGWLLLTVPAHSARFGPADEAVGHYRRYDSPSLRALLERSGWTVEAIESYGAGLGQMLDTLRNVEARRRSGPPSASERTARSGRLHQPRSRLHIGANRILALAGRAAQHPFRATEVGSGYVALARATTLAGGRESAR
jgi:SAM-dependent methyltransferase